MSVRIGTPAQQLVGRTLHFRRWSVRSNWAGRHGLDADPVPFAVRLREPSGQFDW